MDELRDLIARRADADAARLHGDDFADAFGAAVRGRVRRRRRVRAAGTVGASALAVGLLAVGVVALPPVFEPAQPGPGGGACVEAPWPLVTGPDDLILSGAGQAVTFDLHPDSLHIEAAGSSVDLPIRDGVLDGTAESGESRQVVLPSGDEFDVALAWSNSEISVTLGSGPDESFTVSTQRYGDVGAVDLDHRYHAIDMGTILGEWGWLVWDDAANSPALTVTLTGADEFTVTAPDGSEHAYPLGDDGVATVNWMGEVLIALDMTGDETGRSAQFDDQVTSPVDGTLASAPFCLPPQFAGEDQATNDAGPVSQDPSPLPATSAASPFSCGFVFPSETRAADDLSVDEASWIAPGEALARIEDRLSSRMDSSGRETVGPRVEFPAMIDGSQLLPSLVLNDPVGVDSGGGVTVVEDPAGVAAAGVGTLVDAQQQPAGQVVRGLAFVQVSGGQVVGTLEDPWRPVEAPAVAWTGEHSDGLILINPDTAFSACPGANEAAASDIYAVVGRVLVDSDGTVETPVYAWSIIERP